MSHQFNYVKPLRNLCPIPIRVLSGAWELSRELRVLGTDPFATCQSSGQIHPSSVDGPMSSARL